MHLALKARFSADGHLFHQWNDARPTRLKRVFSACSVGNLNSLGDTAIRAQSIVLLSKVFVRLFHGLVF
jgi:hypothetical protein